MSLVLAHYNLQPNNLSLTVLKSVIVFVCSLQPMDLTLPSVEVCHLIRLYSTT